MTAYLQAQNVSLINVLEGSSENGGTPFIDLEWEPFQTHVEQFLNSIDQYTVAARTEIAARASDHTAAVRDLSAAKEEAERKIQLEKEKERDMLSTIESERRSLNELTSSLNTLQSKLSKVREQSASVEAELNSVKKEVRLEKQEKERQKKALEEMRSRDGEELKSLEDLLGFRVDGVKENQLLMRFTLIDPDAPEREFSFVIDVSKPVYTVPRCDPPLANLPDLVARLNEDRQFFGFIKRVRKAFTAMVPSHDPGAKFDDLGGMLKTPSLTQSRVLKSIQTPRTVGAEGRGGDGGMDNAMEGLRIDQ